MLTTSSPLLALAAAVAATVTALLITPVVIALAHRIGAIDLPDERKVHISAVPRLGGLAVMLGIAAGWIVLLVGGGAIVPAWRTHAPGFAIGAGLVFAIGCVDDVHRLGALPKLAVQLAAAWVAWHYGIRFDHVSVPFVGDTLDLGAAALPVNLFWIVLITNAWNLIDGLDGLAASLGFVAATLFALVLFVRGHDAGLIFAVPLIGALLGFLPYNLNPAQIFLGDSGSYLIGYLLALLSILTGQKSVASFAVFMPLAVLALPLIDTTWAVFRRLGSDEPATLGQRLRGVFQADRHHIHHRLLDRGLAPARVVRLLVALAGGLGSLGLVLTFNHEPRAAGLLMLVSAMAFWIALSSRSAVDADHDDSSPAGDPVD
ncbi:MAG: undecaprenyl/decaprenyl-phosphate alpha-N-acetylglucosaminyl 1-phosphate transferase [Candidatus Dadabacteria bacterium]|nr:MAG: undecaprenyl/decaprenyl-phosphate alpha-N-acetylglucosaminyl 1-phosphate transferase [Candidatus Dadabacteria bacterium]